MSKNPLFSGKSQRYVEGRHKFVNAKMYGDLTYKAPLGQMKSAARKRKKSTAVQEMYNARRRALKSQLPKK